MKRRKQNDYKSINMLLLIQLRKQMPIRCKLTTYFKCFIKHFFNFYNNGKRFINVCISTRYVNYYVQKYLILQIFFILDGFLRDCVFSRGFCYKFRVITCLNYIRCFYSTKKLFVPNQDPARTGRSLLKTKIYIAICW